MSSEYQLNLKAVLDTSQIKQELNKIQSSTKNGGLKFDMKELDQLQSKLEKLRSYIQQFKLNINVDDIDNALKKIKTIRVKPIIDQTELQKDFNIKASTSVNVGGGKPIVVNTADNTVLKNVNSSLTKLNSNFTKANSNTQRNVLGNPFLPTKNSIIANPPEYANRIKKQFERLGLTERERDLLLYTDIDTSTQYGKEYTKTRNKILYNHNQNFRNLSGREINDLKTDINNIRAYYNNAGVFQTGYFGRKGLAENILTVQNQNEKIQKLNTQQIASFAAQYFANNIANLEEPLRNIGWEKTGIGVGIAGRSAAQGLGAFGALAGMGVGAFGAATGGGIVLGVTALIELANAAQETKRRFEELSKSISENAVKTQQRSEDTYNKAYTSTFDSLASRLSIEELEKLKTDADKKFSEARGNYEGFRDKFQERKKALEDEYAGYIEKNPKGELAYIAQRDKQLNLLNEEGDNYQKAFNDAKSRQEMITSAYNERKAVVDNYTKVLKELTNATSTEILTEKELEKAKKRIVDLLNKGISTGKERKEIDQLLSDYSKNKTAFDLEEKTKKQYETLAQNQLDVIAKNEDLKSFNDSLDNRDKESIKGDAEQINKEMVLSDNRIKELSEKALNKNLTAKEKKTILDEIDAEKEKLSDNKNKMSIVETWFSKYKSTEVGKLQDQLSKLKPVDTSHATSLGQYGYGMGVKDDSKQILKSQEYLMKEQKEIQDEIKQILEEKLPVDSTFS